VKSYLLDTSAYSNLVRGHKKVANLVRSADEIYVSIFTIAELEYGFACGSKRSENQMLLLRFLSSKKVKTLMPDHYTVSSFASIGRKAKDSGVVLAHHDLWITSLAVQNNLTLMTFDKDFLNADTLKIKGYKVEFLV